MNLIFTLIHSSLPACNGMATIATMSRENWPFLAADSFGSLGMGVTFI
jgi:hypothetical protein